MEAWAPDIVTAGDRAHPAMLHAKDIHDATIELVYTMIPYILEGADTRDVGLWGFIYVILVFVRSLKTRPALLGWFGLAFHPKTLALFLNMLLRDDETRGGTALESARQSEMITVCSEGMPGNLLPEHYLLLGSFFAREAEPCGTFLDDVTKGFAVVASMPAPEVTEVEVEPVEEPAVEEEQEISLSDCETDSVEEDGVDRESENETEDERSTNAKSKSKAQAQQTEREVVEAQLEMEGTGAENASVEVERLGEESENEARQQDTQTKDKVCKNMPGEDEQKAMPEDERKEKEVCKHEGFCHDPPLFPNGWFENSNYDFEEFQNCDYIQSARTCRDRFDQILRLAAQLDGCFFVFEIDEDGRHWISEPGASSIPKPDSDKKMPETNYGGGVRVVHIHPASHAAEIEGENRREEKWQEEEENADTTDVATLVDEEARDDAEEVSAADNIPDMSQTTDVVEQRPAQSDQPIDHAHGLRCFVGDNGPANAEHSEAGTETLVPVQGVDDSQDTKGSDAGPDASAFTVLAEDPATAPQASVELSEDVLDKMPGMEKPAKAIERWRAQFGSKEPGADEGQDDDSWTRVSNESHGDAETSVQTAQPDTRSMFSRFFFG